MANLSITEVPNGKKFTLEMSEDEMEIIVNALDFVPDKVLPTELRDTYDDLLDLLLKTQPEQED